MYQKIITILVIKQTTTAILINEQIANNEIEKKIESKYKKS